MKAIARAADLFALADVDPPEPGPGEVLVNVRAAGVDHNSTRHLKPGPHLKLVPHRRTGPHLKPGPQPEPGPRRAGRRVAGLDLAGTVAAVGAGVTKFRPGDEVFGSGAGAFAELAVARQDQLALKPVPMSFVEAAGVPGAACAALQGLRDRGHLQPAQSVLIIGAGGGVGGFAVQIAKALGAHVTGVCGAAEMDLVRSLGADEVLAAARDGVLRLGLRHDLVFDTTGEGPIAALRRVVAPRGTLVLVGRQLRAVTLSPFVRQRLAGLRPTTRADDLRTVRDLIEAGLVTTPVDRTFPLAQAAAAIRHFHEGHPTGHVILTI